MGHVFISYKTEDRARVKLLVDAIEAEGLSVWWDVHIEAGAAWREVIQTKLDDADCVLVVWSRNSVGGAGRFVQDEAMRADRRGVYLPVAIDEVEAPLGFGQQQMLWLPDWSGNRRDPHFLDLIAAVRAVIAGGPRPTPRATVVSPGSAKRGRRAILIGGAALVPVALGGAWWLSRGRLSPAPVAPAHSIAVLPFANLSGDPAQDYFSEGLSEEVRSALARIDALQVAARASSNVFKDARQSVSAIAHKLGVAFVLDGTVRKEGDTVRVSAQLVEASSGFERWSQSYDRPMRDVFAIQSDIAQLVADALRVRVLGVAPATATGATRNAAAYDFYLRGRQLYDLGAGEDSFRQALASFDAALSADPAFAAAHAARARALIAIANQFAKGEALRGLYDEGLKSAQKSVELAPDLAAAQSTLGFARLAGRLDVRGASEPYERARRLGQGDAGVLLGYGAYASMTGRFDAAMTALERAALLDPLNPRVYRALGSALYAARRYAEAINRFRHALTLSPGMNFAHAAIGNCLLLQGHADSARAEFMAEPLKVTRLTGIAIVEFSLGKVAASKAALHSLVADLGDNSLYQQGEVLARWGDRAAALDALERAYAAGDSGLTYLRNDPLLDSLRAEPRYIRLLGRIGFV